ncbi:MAG: polyphenol oxidase family protein [Candidatus Competibacteraceae bacterium]
MSELTDSAGLTAHRRGDLSYYRLQSLPIRHGFFTRIGGFSQAPYAGLNTAYVTKDPQATANRELLLNTLGLDAVPLRILNPCHGEKIVFMDPADWRTNSHDVLIKTDAAFTTTPHSYFLVSTGDCIPAIFSDMAASFVGIIHLGWRNLLADFAYKVVHALQTHYGVTPDELVVGLGPSIYPCCYVFQEPQQKDDPFWRPFLQDRGKGYYGIDLLAAFKAQLVRHGVKIQNIHETGLCTGCHNDLFFSCYKEGYVSGRFPTVVGLQQGEFS